MCTNFDDEFIKGLQEMVVVMADQFSHPNNVKINPTSAQSNVKN